MLENVSMVHVYWRRTHTGIRWNKHSLVEAGSVILGVRVRTSAAVPSQQANRARYPSLWLTAKGFFLSFGNTNNEALNPKCFYQLCYQLRQAGGVFLPARSTQNTLPEDHCCWTSNWKSLAAGILYSTQCWMCLFSVFWPIRQNFFCCLCNKSYRNNLEFGRPS